MKADTAGLILFGLAEPVQVMSGFLPSPATAEAAGGNPERHDRFHRDMLIGGGISVGISVAIALMTYPELGKSVWWLPIGSTGIILVFCWEFKHALAQGKRENNTEQGLGF
jgi:hypothetical protein